MTLQFQSTSPQERRGGSNRDGIVLLVVLGMLTLFSVLGVSYLVFTGRQRNAAGQLNTAESGTIDADPLMEDALKSILVGANGPYSSLWGNDLLGDLYGQRDAIEGYVIPAANMVNPREETQPAILLDGQMIRFGTLLHFNAPADLSTVAFPQYLNRYPYGRNDIQGDRRYPGYVGGVYDLDNPTSPETTGASIPRFPMDDELNDRLLTFREGPLEGLTFPIVRYFGDHTGARDAANFPQGRDQLSGQTIIDIRGQLDATITLGEQSLTLQEWLDDPDFRVASLFYRMDNVFSALAFNEEPYGFFINGRMLNGPGFGWDRPRRSQTGAAHFQSVRGIDRQASTGASNPPAPFNLNDVVSTLISATRVENGGTVTAFSAAADDPNAGSDHPVTALDYRDAEASGPAMIGHSLSELGPDVPTALQANFALHRLAPDRGIPSSAALAEQIRVYLQDLPPGDADEPYDAPDFNNMFLSYFPGEELLGESAPSFVRPALINWILNNVTDSRAPTAGRLRQAFVALERSTMRPLPFIDTPTTPASAANRGSGVKRLNYANFTGGNESDGLSEPINFNSNDTAYLQAKLLEVAQSLAGQDIDGDGIVDSWDVDNNGDGIVDSVWIDAGLPLTQTADGRLIKPLVSYMVEDLGGRVNVNLAGNILQARLDSVTPGPSAIRRTLEGAIQTSLGTPVITATPSASPHLVYTNAAVIPPQQAEAFQAGLPSGWGYGPAEIDISQIFQPRLATSTFTVNPVGTGLSSYTATDLIRGPQRIMAERAGMFSSIFGRQPPTSNMDDASYPYPIASARGQIFVPAGDVFDPVSNAGVSATTNPNDFIGMIRKPGMPNLHRLQHPQGLPVDVWGRGSVGLGVTGDLTVSGTSHITTSGGPYGGTAPNLIGAGDTLKDPYEFAMNAVRDPDEPFTYADLEPLLNGAGLDRDLLSQRLIEIIEDYHNTEDINGNGSLDRALGEGPDPLEQVRQALADSMTTHSNSVATVRGGLPSEFASNTAIATSAGGPQEHIKQTMALANPAATNQEINAVLWELMPPDLRAGRKFNLNRPFGNGFDDDGDGVIDDDQNGVFNGTTTTAVAEAYFDSHLLGEGGASTPFTTGRGNSSPGELNNNFPVSATNPIRIGVSPRAQFARHLYVMTMMLIRDANTGNAFDFPHRHQIPPSFDSPFFGSADPLEEFNEEHRAWKIAQWAVNVADFRDADGVMTRFDYDPNPFDGWDVALEDERTYRTVWGLERPELTLEESIAFHDRRVRDTNADVSGQKSLEGSDGSATRGEDDMDQYRIPQGSLFLELRNTRSPQELRLPGTEFDPVANPPSYPNELYASSATGPGLNLGALAPARSASTGHPAVPPMPVWRVAISEAHCPDADLPGANGDRHSAMVNGGLGAASKTVPFYEASPDFLFRPAGVIPAATVATLDGESVFQDRDTATLNLIEPQFFEDVSGAISGNSVKTAQRDRAIERVIVFTPGLTSVDVASMATALPELDDAGQIFYNRFNSNEYVYNSGGNVNELLVPPGQHVVIGPRPTTHIGARKQTAGMDVANPDTGAPQVDYVDFESPQRFELTPHQLSYYQIDGTDQTPTVGRLVGPNPAFPNNPQAVVDASIRPVVGIQAAADAPASWTTLTTPIGVNVSEPIPYQNTATSTPAKPTGREYYTEPTSALDSARGFPIDAYRDYDGGGTGDLPDTPFDSRPGMSELHRVLGDDGVRTGTRMFFKTAYLQRLADPTQPYHPDFNPYISVDYITIDLTVFNGSEDNSDSKMDNAMGVLWPDTEDEQPYTSAPLERLNTRYKTGKKVYELADTGRSDNLTHSVSTRLPNENSAPTTPLADPLNFEWGLSYDTNLSDPDNLTGAASRTQYSPSLGYANHSYGPRWRQGPNAPSGGGYNEAQRSVSAFVGLPHDDSTNAAESGYYRDLMWLNRPFVSAHELMWVPTSGPGRIGLEFGVSADSDAADAGGSSPQITSDQYDPLNNTISSPPPANAAAVTAGTEGIKDVYGFNERFTHLWNYFSSSSVFQYTPATSITEPYPDIPPREPAPNFYRILEWVGVPTPYDFESDFISPFNEVARYRNHLFGRPLDYKTFGPVRYPPVTGPVTPLASVDGDPRTWTTAVPSGNIGFVPEEGVWRDTSPSPGAWNGFWTNYVATEPFRPPFNIRDSLFRSGLVNLNTIKNIRSYKAVVSAYSTTAELNPTIPVGEQYPLGLGAFFEDFVRSRAGYIAETGGPTAANNFFEEGAFPLQAFDSDGDGTADTPSFDRNIPTQFAGVFRSAMGANIAPLESMRERPADPTQDPWDYTERDSGGTDNPRIANSETHSTLVRQKLDRQSSSANDKPVFARVPTDPAVSTAGAHEPSVVNQQLGLTRMSNLATDQSNVFAVWVTVGLFEVDSRTLTVGQEYGSDLGTAQRQRGFYIIDRSKPVMYEPGEWNNARETVVYERVR